MRVSRMFHCVCCRCDAAYFGAAPTQRYCWACIDAYVATLAPETIDALLAEEGDNKT